MGCRLPLSVAILCLAWLPLAVSAQSHAVILLYHHVDDDTPESTSVTPAVFRQHLQYLWDHNFFVLPLEEILDAVANGRPLPENSVAITFDDAYESVHRIAWPALKERRWPFTVFVTTDLTDNAYGAYMDWEQLRELLDGGGSIGNHGSSHVHPVSRLPGEEKEAWLARFRENILRGAERIESETGKETRVFAYPYGEFNRDLEAVVGELGWYGLGQQSGALGTGMPLTSAPRFPLSTGYADDRSFRLRVHSRPLPVTVIGPQDRLLYPIDGAPRLELELQGDDIPPESVRCYSSNGEAIPVSWDDERRFSVRAASPLPAGRSKYTCTAPYPDEDGVFGWYSWLWITLEPGN